MSPVKQILRPVLSFLIFTTTAFMVLVVLVGIIDQRISDPMKLAMIAWIPGILFVSTIAGVKMVDLFVFTFSEPVLPKAGKKERKWNLRLWFIRAQAVLTILYYVCLFLIWIWARK